MDDFRYTDPGALDLMAKGDDYQVLVKKPHINKNTNKGRKQRQKNTELKKIKLKKIIETHPYYTYSRISEKGYIKPYKNSKRSNYLKKLTSHRARQFNRHIDDEDSAHINRKYLVDYDWEMY